MDARKERRGRKGGTANAGAFYAQAMLGKWYTTESVKAHFESKGVTLHYQEARAIFDALRRSKCYPCEEKSGPKGRKGHVRPMISFTEKKEEITDVPNFFKSICSESIRSYFTSFLITRQEQEQMRTIRRTYDIGDKNLMNVAKIHADKKPIKFDGTPFSIVAWDREGKSIRVLFKEIPREEAIAC
ncbi:hypothetical protein [Aliivibrio salmonicida]|uniref:hypothetical protein n=1 Tax=Aliivibrio salmonicida TaxID=40269 RepID=UPI003D0B8502